MLGIVMLVNLRFSFQKKTKIKAFLITSENIYKAKDRGTYIRVSRREEKQQLMIFGVLLNAY